MEEENEEENKPVVSYPMTSDPVYPLTSQCRSCSPHTVMVWTHSLGYLQICSHLISLWNRYAVVYIPDSTVQGSRESRKHFRLRPCYDQTALGHYCVRVKLALMTSLRGLRQLMTSDGSSCRVSEISLLAEMNREELCTDADTRVL